MLNSRRDGEIDRLARDLAGRAVDADRASMLDTGAMTPK
jgi:hypothetical protein